VILRRVLLIVSGLLWLGMVGTLGVREHRKRVQAAGAAGYLDSIFGPDAPALVRKSMWLQDPFGAEQEIGFVETQTQRIGSLDAKLTTLMEIRGDKIPPFAAAALTELAGPPADFSGELQVYVGRYKGVSRIDGKGSYGEERGEFQAIRRGEKSLRITTRHGKEHKTSTIPYDPAMPFGGGVSPFLSAKNLKKGDSWTVTYFNPFTRSSSTTLIKVEEEAVLRYKREDVNCLVLRAHPTAAGGAGESSSYGPYTSSAWIAQKPGDKIDGLVLREETQLLLFKLALVLEESVSAEELDYHKTLYPKGKPDAKPEKAGAPEKPGPPEKAK
jgi:hypothetical protein